MFIIAPHKPSAQVERRALIRKGQPSKLELLGRTILLEI
jgi:hypothetical protein